MRRSRGRKLIGQMLVERGHITDEQLEQALETQKQTTQRLGEILMDLGFIEEEPLYECLAEQLNVAYANLKKLSPDPNVAGLITREMATRYMALPLARGEAGTIQVAMAEPADVIALDDLKMKLQVQVEPMLAPASPARETSRFLRRKMRGLTTPPMVPQAISHKTTLQKIAECSI